MAAPLGFKTFVTGDVLTAADTNGYLMQGIWTFANATARDAAVTSPQEGNTCYLKDIDVIQVYSGSAWVVKSGSSPLTTKGDLFTYSTTDARLAVGANDTVLIADSTAITGLKWGTPSSGGMTLISEQVLSASTGYSFTSISGSYKQLLLVWSGIYHSAATTIFDVRLNADSGSNYHSAFLYGTDTSFTATSAALASVAYSAGNTTATFGNNVIASTLGASSQMSQGYMVIDNYSSASKYKKLWGQFGYYNSTNNRWNNLNGMYASTSAITSIDITRLSGTATVSNLANTSVRLYGVS